MTTPMIKKRREGRTRSLYQAHVSTILSAESSKNVFDLTEKKLQRLAVNHPDDDIRKLATRMLQDYLKGIIAIAWEDGKIPIYCFLKL
jgi:hypothetical protein